MTSCGDGIVDTDVGEECDDGNNLADDTCVSKYDSNNLTYDMYVR